MADPCSPMWCEQIQSRSREHVRARQSLLVRRSGGASSSTAGRLACFISTHPPTPCRHWEQSEIMLYVACVCGVFGMCSASGAGCGYVAPSQGSHSHASFPFAYLKANALKADTWECLGVPARQPTSVFQRFLPASRLRKIISEPSLLGLVIINESEAAGKR